MSRFSNLKSRLMLLVLIALAPVILLILYSDIRHRHSIATDVRDNLSSLNFLAKDNLNKFFDTTRLLLITLSKSAEVQKGSYSSISVFFRDLHKHYPDYVNIGMADLKGNLVCSALPLTRQVNSADLFWFQEAVKTRDFSIGEYQIGRIAGQPVLVLSWPVFDEAGRMKAVLYLSIKLDWLKRLVTNIKLPEGYEFMITDRKGTILSRHPESDKWTGKLIPEAPLIKAVLSQKNGIAEITGLDGVTRMYAFSTAGYGENHIYVAVGMSKAAAFKEINQILLIDLLLLIALGGVGLVIARLYSNTLILRPVNALKNAAENLSRGNFSARTGYADRTDELGSLAGIFDNMAEAVEKEISIRKKAQEDLHQKTEELDSYFNNALDLFCIADTDGYFRRINKEWETTLGFNLEELEGKRFLDFVHPDDMKSTLEAVSRLEAQKEVLNFENRYRCRGGSYRWIEWRSISSGKLIYAAARDITERKQAEEKILKLNRVYAVISQINQTIVREREKDKILSEACRIAVEYGKFRMAWIGMIDEETHLVKPIAYSGIEEAYFSTIKKISIDDVPEGRGPTGTAVRESRHYVCDDIENDPRMEVWREEALKRGYRSSMALPIRQSGKVIGVFSLYASVPDFFDQEEIHLLDEVTNDISFAIDAIETAEKKMEAEETLRESEERLRAVIEQSPVGIAFSRDGITLDANKVYVSMFGYANIDELRGTPLINQIAPQCREAIIDKVTRRAQGQEVEITYETIGLRKDDSQFPFQVSASRIVLPDGPLTISYFNDITERKCAEEALREKEHLLSESQRIAHIGSWGWDLTGPIKWTDETYRIYGVSPETFTPTTESLVNLLHPEDRPAMQRWLEACGAGQSPADLEFRVILPDGSVRLLSGRGELIYDTENRPVYMAGTVQDITERKRAEEELRKHREHLEDMIKERTAKLERVNRLFVGRELRMKELKEKIAKLEKEGGKVS